VQTRRPGLEVVIAAHKSVAELGVMGRAEDMHRIMDAERDATLAYLDRVTRQMGGRRGQAANVAELNRRARSWMEASGRLSGPELACSGGATYRAGDRVVTLAPGAAGTLVTSQRATVEAVEPDSGSLVLRTDDGRQVRLTGEEIGADGLDTRPGICHNRPSRPGSHHGPGPPFRRRRGTRTRLRGHEPGPASHPCLGGS